MDLNAILRDSVADLAAVSRIPEYTDRVKRLERIDAKAADVLGPAKIADILDLALSALRGWTDPDTAACDSAECDLRAVAHDIARDLDFDPLESIASRLRSVAGDMSEGRYSHMARAAE